MRFAKAGAAVDEERVAVGEEGFAGNAFGGSKGFVVRRCGHEVLEAIVGVEVAFKGCGNSRVFFARRRGEEVGVGAEFEFDFSNTQFAQGFLQHRQ